jgi:hypothetical protein
VQVLYNEDVANHIAPEPCVVFREGQDEASAGDHAGWPSSRERRVSRTPTGLHTRKATQAAASTRVASWSGVVGESPFIIRAWLVARLGCSRSASGT